MSCCGRAPKPIMSDYKQTKPYDPRTKTIGDARQSSSVEYCDACESIMMIVIVAGKERKQCTNPQCRKIQR